MDNQNMYTNQDPQSLNRSQPQTELEAPVSMGEWLVSFLLMMIPCVNIVMMFVWAFSKSEKKSKSNFFKVTLILAAISIVLWVILFATLGVSLLGFLGSYNY